MKYGSPENEKLTYEEAKRLAKSIAVKHIKLKLSADNVEEKTPVWYFAMGVITSINEDKS